MGKTACEHGIVLGTDFELRFGRFALFYSM